ncbi:MAG: transglycosylase SLT domain-containing protein [Oligoflexia bacterium]|nr:transglycosylase SLT domain-containing protein [Oligoflexia bacterium]
MGKSPKKKNKFQWWKFWIVVIPGFFVTNWIYHAIKKPAEIIGLVDHAFYKHPTDTWKSHGDLFVEHSTSVISPEFLAALAQAESNGNPIARTYWTWNLSTNPFEIYKPASSATGMFQITDGTFSQAKQLCIRDGQVEQEGPWYELNSCWFNFLYSRTIASHSVEMTSAFLHLHVSKILEKFKFHQVTELQKQNLAAIIHLCGAKKGERFARSGFRVKPNDSCGAHNVSRYLKKINTLRSTFQRLSLTSQ